jgi:hypothetical protein
MCRYSRRKRFQTFRPPGGNNRDELRNSLGKNALFRLPAANRTDDASRRYAEMKSSLLKDPVCGEQRVSLVSLSQGRHEFDPLDNTKCYPESGDANKPH